MGLQEVVVMMHEGEYSRAIAWLENEFRDETVQASQKLEYCKWLADCNKRLEDHQEAGNWYLEAVKIILAQNTDGRTKAKVGMPLCNCAVEEFEKEGDPADVLVAARVKQYLAGISK